MCRKIALQEGGETADDAWLFKTAAKNKRRASMLPRLDSHHNDNGHNDGHDNESNAEPFPSVLVQPLGVHKRGGALLHVFHALGDLHHSRRAVRTCSRDSCHAASPGNTVPKKWITVVADTQIVSGRQGPHANASIAGQSIVSVASRERSSLQEQQADSVRMRYMDGVKHLVLEPYNDTCHSFQV